MIGDVGGLNEIKKWNSSWPRVLVLWTLDSMAGRYRREGLGMGGMSMGRLAGDRQ